MGVRETNILKLCQLEAAKHGCLLLRNNVGMAVTKDGRHIKYGLGVGSPDLVGWTSMGRFVGAEIKDVKGVLSKEQLNFLKRINACGGLGIVAYSQEDVKKCLITGESNVSLFDKGDTK